MPYRHSSAQPSSQRPAQRFRCRVCSPADTPRRPARPGAVAQVTADAKFVDLGADSLDTVEIMMALEEKVRGPSQVAGLAYQRGPCRGL